MLADTGTICVLITPTPPCDSDGSYLEDQDMWRLSGIQRSVYLFLRPRAAMIADYFAAATLDASYEHGKLDLTVQVRTNSQVKGSLRLDIELRPPTGEFGLVPVWQRGPIWQQKIDVALRDTDVKLSTLLLNALAWSAEQPWLYTLCLSLFMTSEPQTAASLLEATCTRVGFRIVEIRGAQLLVNGRAVGINGVNRHEHDPRTGHAVSPEAMLVDVRRMKEFNINAVRNSHYTNDPYWYNLADEHGLYILDEANIESHGHW